jgi:hypothetical protein
MLGGYEFVKYARTNEGQRSDVSSKTKFTLCSDGSMQYYHRSRISVSGEGAGGKDDSEKEDHGTWKAIDKGNGLKLIMMKSTKYGTTEYLEVKPLGGSKVRLLLFNEWQEFLMKKIDC